MTQNWLTIALFIWMLHYKLLGCPNTLT